MALRLSLAAILAGTVAAQNAFVQEDLVSMIQRGAENTPPPPRPRGHRIHLPDQAEVQSRMKTAVEGVTGEADRVVKEFIETDKRHYDQIRVTEAEDKWKHHHKEARRQQEQREKRNQLHHKKLDSWAERNNTVESEKKLRETEKVAHQEAEKIEMHRKEEEMVKIDNDQKEAEYEARNAKRAEKEAERDAKLKERKRAKAIERQRIAAENAEKERREAEFMASGKSGLPPGMHF